jgi:Leucine-rich repeat (LRR) protein
MTSFRIDNAKITYLTIEDNLLTKIEKDTFKKMFNMQDLILKNNLISSIHLESFKDMEF